MLGPSFLNLMETLGSGDPGLFLGKVRGVAATVELHVGVKEAWSPIVTSNPEYKIIDNSLS